MNENQTWLTKLCLCGWPVPPTVELRAGRLLIDWECPICGAEWHHYEHVPEEVKA